MKTRKIVKIFIIIFIINFTFAVNVNAKTGDTFVTDDGKYNYTSNVIENKQVGPGTYFTKDFGYTTRGSEQYKQEVFMLSQKSDASKGMKAVTWSAGNPTSSVSTAFSRVTLDKIAEDYEANHPGWKVIGGISSDQFYFSFGTGLVTNGSDVFYNTPYYGMKADGEDWFTMDALGRAGANMTGFLNSGSENQLVYGSRSLSGFKLNVYDENNNFVKKFDITELNPLSKNKKTSGDYTYLYSIYSAYYFESEDAFYNPNNTDPDYKSENPSENKLLKEYPVSSNNDLYVIGAADKAYVSNSKYWKFKGSFATDAFFGKGTITSVEKSVNLKAKQFAIETTNQELLNVLKKGCYVVAQYELDDEMEQCESAIGWHTLQRYEGKDQNVSNSYNSRPYPRSVLGVTEDGTIYFISSNGGNSRPLWGLYGEEVNALCKGYGIKTAFQMDGGGSVTMVLRNEKGGFDFVTTPADGNQRSICGGLFFVVRDVDYEANVTARTNSSISLKVNVSDYGYISNVEKTYVNVNGRNSDGGRYYSSRELTADEMTFYGLASNSEYNVTLSFKIKDSEDYIESLSTVTVKTLKTNPTISKANIEVGDDKTLKISVTLDDPDASVITSLKVSFDNGETFTKMSSSNAITITDFKGDPLGNVVFEIMYDLNEGHTKSVLVPLKMNYNTYTFLDSLYYQYNKNMESILN